MSKPKKMAVNRPTYVHPDNQDHRNATDETRMSVFGGHRAGKRKRGTSVTKRMPNEASRVVPMDIHGADGRIIALGVRTVSNRPTRADMGEDAWNGLASIPLNRALPSLNPSRGRALGTVGSTSVRSVPVHTTETVDIGAVARFLSVVNDILALPEELPKQPTREDAPKYAKSKPLPRDPWGRV